MWIEGTFVDRCRVDLVQILMIVLIILLEANAAHQLAKIGWMWSEHFLGLLFSELKVILLHVLHILLWVVDLIPSGRDSSVLISMGIDRLPISRLRREAIHVARSRR